MGYDRYDCWMTCGERDDRGDVTVEMLTDELCEIQDRLGPGCDEHAIAQALFRKYILVPVANGSRDNG